MWLVGVVVRRYIDILIIIINFPYSTCIRSFFGSSKNKNKKPKWRFLTSRGAHVNCAIIIHSCYRKSAVEHDGGV